MSLDSHISASVPAKAVPEPKFELPLNSIIELDGRDMLVERKLLDRWHFLDLRTNEPAFKTDRELAQLQASGLFRVKTMNGKALSSAQPLSPLVVGCNGKDNLKKHAYVEVCLNAPGGIRRSRPLLNPIIQKLAEARGEKSPGFTTVLQWVDEFDQYGDQYGTASYSDRHDLKGQYGHQLLWFQEAAVQRGVDRWLARMSTPVAYAAVCRYVELFDAQSGRQIDKKALGPEFVDENNRLKPPSLRTLQRRCEEVDPLLADWMRKGPRAAKDRHRTFSTLQLPDLPYHEVEVDHCTLDIFLIDPSGLVLGRPDLIIFRDRATAMIIGHSLGYNVPSYAAFVCGLRHAMYPKDLSLYPSIKNPWPCFGRIKNLFVDNALHFIGDNIRAAGRDLNFNLVRFRPKQPWLKGALERFFRSFGVAVVHLLPGTTLENVLVRREHENLGDASLTVAEFEALFNRWICDDFHVSKRKALGPLRGFGDVPLRVWTEKAAKFVTPPLPSEELFVALAGDREMRVINRYGVEWDYIKYEGPILAQVLTHPNHRDGMKYQIVRDPMNLGCVFLVNHHTNEFLRIPATTGHVEYASGRTLHQHNVTITHAKRLVDDWAKDHWSTIIKARDELAQIATRILRSPRRKTVERKVARFLEWDRGRPLRSHIAVPQPSDGSGERYLDFGQGSARPNQTPQLVVGDADDRSRKENAEFAPHPLAIPAQSDSDDAELAELKLKRKWSATNEQ